MLVFILLGLLAVAHSRADNIAAQLFDGIDDNKDGVIVLAETFAGYNNDDLNEDGLLTLEEFAAGTHPGSPPLTVKDAFKLLDKLSGHLDNILDPTAAFTIFKGLDTNNNREITFQEFEENYLRVI